MSSSVSAFSRTSSYALAYDGPSSAGTSALSDSSNNIDADGFLQGAHRAGGPNLLPLPVYSQGLDSEYNKKTAFYAVDNVEQTILVTRHILQAKYVVFKYIDVTGRRSKGQWSKVDPEPLSSVPTIMIVVPNFSYNAAWRDTAKAIHQHFISAYPGISVEILEDSLLEPCQCFPVPQSHSIFSKWDGICATILSNLRIAKWTAVDCWRYGTSSNEAENPVTVIVSVYKGTKQSFFSDIQRIRGILAVFGETDDVAILFLEDELNLHCSLPVLPMDACTHNTQPGVSIGIHDSSAGPSTLGGMVELSFKDSPNDWQPFALTCFHCVFAPDNHRQNFARIPGADQAFRKWPDRPVFPEDNMAPKLLQVDHPALADIERAAENTNDIIKRNKDLRFHSIESRLRVADSSGLGDTLISNNERRSYERTKSYVSAFEAQKDYFDQFIKDGAPYLGPVFAGSGLNRWQQGNKRPCVLDWALIKVSNKRRVGENMPFDHGGSVSRIAELKAFSLGDPNIENDMTVFKVGRSTEITKGNFHRLRSANLIHEGILHDGGTITIPTWEHSILNHYNQTFSEPGDSGSFVFGQGDKVIGLLLGGWEMKNVTYFTPIRAVFEDIKAITGACDVRILE